MKLFILYGVRVLTSKILIKNFLSHENNLSFELQHRSRTLLELTHVGAKVDVSLYLIYFPILHPNLIDTIITRTSI